MNGLKHYSPLGLVGGSTVARIQEFGAGVYFNVPTLPDNMYDVALPQSTASPVTPSDATLRIRLRPLSCSTILGTNPLATCDFGSQVCGGEDRNTLLGTAELEEFVSQWKAAEACPQPCMFLGP
eukprot:1988773-Rhodomonas_salina.9